MPREIRLPCRDHEHAPARAGGFTITEAVAYSKYARRTIYKRIADGTLPAYLPRGSRVLRIDGDDLDAMITAEGRIPSAHLSDGRPAARPPARTGR